MVKKFVVGSEGNLKSAEANLSTEKGFSQATKTKFYSRIYLHPADKELPTGQQRWRMFIEEEGIPLLPTALKNSVFDLDALDTDGWLDDVVIP